MLPLAILVGCVALMTNLSCSMPNDGTMPTARRSEATVQRPSTLCTECVCVTERVVAVSVCVLPLSPSKFLNTNYLCVCVLHMHAYECVCVSSLRSADRVLTVCELHDKQEPNLTDKMITRSVVRREVCV